MRVPRRADHGTAQETIDTALALFDQSLTLLAQHMPAVAGGEQPGLAAPLPSLLAQCEMRLDLMRQRRGARLIYVMPGLLQSDPSWWRRRTAGLHCVRLEDLLPGAMPQVGDERNTAAHMLRSTIAGIWQQTVREGRELLVLATPGAAADLDIPLSDRILLATHPWQAFSTDRKAAATLDALCLATLHLLETDPDLQTVLPVSHDAEAATEASGDPMAAPARTALEKLGLAEHWRAHVRATASDTVPQGEPDPELIALSPAYGRLCDRLGVDAAAIVRKPEPDADVPTAPVKARASETVSRITSIGLAGVPESEIEGHLWSLVNRLDSLLGQVAEFPERLDALARALTSTDGALLKILAAGHFAQMGENLQALSLLAEALDDLPPLAPERHCLQLIVASLQLDLQQPRLAAETVLGGLSGLTPAGEKARSGLIGKQEAEEPGEHGHSLLIAYLSGHLPLPLVRPRLMVEIGTTREIVPGQGSTRRLALFCARHGFDFVTIDMDPRNTSRAKRLFDRLGLPFRTVAARGEDWLAAFPGPIDFIFLDAYDFDHGKHSELRQSRYERYLGGRIDEAECHQMHLDCARALVNSLAPDGLICLDDTWTDAAGRWTAKGTTAMPFLLENGFELIEARNRSALLRRQH